MAVPSIRLTEEEKSPMMFELMRHIEESVVFFTRPSKFHALCADWLQFWSLVSTCLQPQLSKKERKIRAHLN